MKRVLSLFLSCIFVLGVCFSTPIIASAAELTFESGGSVFQYEESSTECSVEKWNGSDVALTLTNVQDENKITYTITGILSGAFSGCTALETLTIKSNIKTIEAGAFAGCTALTEFIEDIDSPNSNFEVVDGVLFNQNKTTLIAYPAAKEGTEYTIPATVTEIADGAFSGANVYLFSENSDGSNILGSENLKIHYEYNSEKGYKHNYVDAVCTVCELVCEHTGLTCGEEDECEICGETFTVSHEWTFIKQQDSENVIIATCGNANCNYAEENAVTITLASPTDGFVYDGSKKTVNVTVSAENTGIQIPEIKYSGDCINAGDYTASITLGDVTVSVEFTIEKATATFTAPTANTKLTYSGQPQALVEAGSTSDGEFQYKLAEDDEWSTTVPAATDAGSYVVYYRVVGNENYSDVEEQSFNVTIAPKTIDVSLINESYKYDGSHHVLQFNFADVVTELRNGTDYEVKCYRNGTPEDNLINIGEIEVVVTLKNTNYSFGVDTEGQRVYEKELTYTITKGVASITTAPTVNRNLVYSGVAQELLTAGEARGGTIYYTVTPDVDNSWSTEIPKETNAGTYTVYYKVIGDENHSDSAEASISVTIGKAPVTISVETQERVYDGTNAVEIKSATVSGVVNDEKVTVNFGGVTATSAGSVVGTHEVDFEGDFELVGETAGNYEIGAVSGATVTITAKPLTITAKNAIVVVNSVMPKFEYTIEGLVDSDSIANVEFVVTVENSSTVVENTATVGEYTLTPSAAVIKKGDTDVTANYDITYIDGKLTVTECTEHDWIGGVCAICKTVCEHGENTYRTEKDSTCVTPGVLVETCKTCKYENELPLEINPNAHEMSDWVETKKATCSAKGVEESKCENEGCNHTVTRETEIDPDTHSYGDWVVTDATCVKTGVKVKTCTNTECSHKVEETIAINPDAHKMATEWEVIEKPTCVSKGLQVKKCLNEGCTHKVEEEIAIAPEAHNLGGWVVTKEAKCTIAGEITKFCKNETCEYKVTAELDPDGKTHTFAEDFTVIEATCILAGSKFKVCLNEGCKEVTEKTEIAINPAAHKNIVTINAKEATCEEKGYTGDKFCNDCKKTVDPGIEINAKGHTESDWIVDKEPTFTEEGAKHTACTVCKKELKKEVIAKRALEVPEVKIENASNGIKVSWSQDEDATGYTVYSSTYNATTKKWSAWKNRGTAAATKSSWTDKTVSEGVTYRYTVRSVNGTNKSNYKATSGLCYVVAPKVTVSITSTGLLAKWNKVNNATSYIVYRRALVNGVWSSWVNLGSTKAEKNTWSDTSVQSGVTYRYTVRAVVGKVKSGYTASSSIIYLAQPVLKISNSAKGITGKWDPIAGATGYTIYRSEYNTSTKKWSKWLTLGTTGATAKTFTDKTVKSGYEYKYTIRAVSGKFKSTYQDSNKLVYLAQPTLKISNVANGIQGKWSQVNGATGYIIYRRELKDGKWSNWTSLGTTKSTAKSFTDKTVKSGVTYSYTIRAKNGSYKSSYVSTGSLVFLSVPTVKISNGITGVNVSWSKIEGATGYLVYRREVVNGKWSGWTQLKTVTETSLVDETVKSGTNYRYTVRALNGKSSSMYTSTGTLYYLTAPTVTVEKVDGVVKVNWTQTVGAKGYTIYRAELGADGKWSKWVTLGTATEKYSSCKDKTAKTGVTYKYTVRAVNGKVKSAYVDGAQITNQ